MFRNLLSRSELVKLEMLELLNQYDDIFLGELADNLEQSPLLVKKYIDEVNQEIDFVELIIDENKLVSLEISPYYSITNIYSLFLENGLAFQALEFLFYKEYPNYEMLADELLVSKSTVIRLVQQINEGIADLDFYVETKPLRIVGVEKNIRQFYTVYFIEKYHGAEFMQRESLARVMQELSFYLDKIIPLAPYFSDIQRITIIMYVISIRERMAKDSERDAAVNGSDMVELLGIEDFIKKESGSHIRKILSVLANHVFMDKEYRTKTAKELGQIFENIFQRFNYAPGQLQLNFSEIVFMYMVGLNLSVPYCIFDKRLERYHTARTGPFYDYLSEMMEAEILASDLPGKSKEHIENVFYLFNIYFPDFKKIVMRRWKPLDVGLFFDTNATHARAVKEELTDFIGEGANFSIENPMERYSTYAHTRKYDLIIGNIAASEMIREKGEQEYLCVDYFLNPKDRGRIIEAVERHIVKQIKA